MNNKTNIFFIGIGGIGMSALARYFNKSGFEVAGYDRTPTLLTDNLIKEGIDIHFQDDISLISDDFKNPAKTLVVYTPAIPKEHTEFNYFKNNNFEILKRAEVLGQIVNQYKGLAVAGTHGKTSVSTLLAHIFNNSDARCHAFLGGISKNYNSNLILKNEFNTGEDFAVVEADEFDRSFLHLKPYAAIVTSADADHLDIYGSKNELTKSFQKFVNGIDRNGFLIKKLGLNLGENHPAHIFTYSLDNLKADFCAENIKLKNGFYTFDLKTSTNTKIKNLKLGIPGLVNVENAVAALSLAHVLGVSDDVIRKSLASFRGIKRRFDMERFGETVYIDDYAHHPKEIEATVKSVKAMFPDKKITGVFQPHLFTRTRDFADEFAASLSLLDKVYLLDIYPAREKPIEGVTSEIILKNINSEKELICKENLLELIKYKGFDVLLTIGAGDIDKLVEPIKEFLKLKN